MKNSRDYLSWALAVLALGFTGLYALEAHFDTKLNDAEAMALISRPDCVGHAAGQRGEELLITCDHNADTAGFFSGLPEGFETVVIRVDNTQVRCPIVDSKPTECVTQEHPSIRAAAQPHSS